MSDTPATASFLLTFNSSRPKPELTRHAAVFYKARDQTRSPRRGEEVSLGMSRRGLCSSSSFASSHPGNAGTEVALRNLLSPLQICSRGCNTWGKGRKPPQRAGENSVFPKNSNPTSKTNQGPGSAGVLPIPVQKAQR